MRGYLDNSGREDVLSGGARMIPVDTPAGRYRVWVKRTTISQYLKNIADKKTAVSPMTNPPK